jgi:hypothetical protein
MGALPRYAAGPGFPLQVLAHFFRCGLFTAIPNATAAIHIHLICQNHVAAF